MRGVEPAGTLSTRLISYLTGKKASYRTAELSADGRFDELREPHFISVAHAHERVHALAEGFRGSLLESQSVGLLAGAGSGAPSPEGARWLNRVIHATIMESAAAPALPAHIASVAPNAQPAAALLRADVEKITRRMYMPKQTECVKPPSGPTTDDHQGWCARHQRG